MPDETQIWAAQSRVGTSAPYKSDSRFRNIRLNERLLTGKSRQRKLILPSDSPFQKRNLNKFPMEYSRTQSKHNADGQHFIRILAEERVRKAKSESENLRQYSLKMFDNAVEVQTHHLDQRRVLSELPSRIMSAHNGPTQNGSLLYNKRSNMLNSIRLRPKSEPPSRFNHLKSETVQPQIRQTLCRSNREFTVSCVSTTKSQTSRSVSTVSNKSEFMLIPNGSVCSDGQNLDSDMGKSEINDSVFDDNDNYSNSSSSVSMDPSFLKRNLPSAEIHFYSIEEDSASESSVISAAPEVLQQEEPKKEQVTEALPETSRPKSGKGRPKSGRSKGSAGSKGKGKRGKSPKGKKGKEKEPTPVTPPPQPDVKVVEAPPVRKPLKGPKCWVDDATITSEKEIVNEEELASQTSKPGSPVLCKTPTKPSVNFKSQVENPEVEIVQTLPEPVKKESSIVLEEIEQYVPNGLPTFICPSSEEKSRQEAIKDWLAKCSFDSASRCVPLF